MPEGVTPPRSIQSRAWSVETSAHARRARARRPWRRSPPPLPPEGPWRPPHRPRRRSEVRERRADEGLRGEVRDGDRALVLLLEGGCGDEVLLDALADGGGIADGGDRGVEFALEIDGGHGFLGWPGSGAGFRAFVCWPEGLLQNPPGGRRRDDSGMTRASRVAESACAVEDDGMTCSNPYLPRSGTFPANDGRSRAENDRRSGSWPARSAATTRVRNLVRRAGPARSRREARPKPVGRQQAPGRRVCRSRRPREVDPLVGPWPDLVLCAVASRASLDRGRPADDAPRRRRQAARSRAAFDLIVWRSTTSARRPAPGAPRLSADGGRSRSPRRDEEGLGRATDLAPRPDRTLRGGPTGAPLGRRRGPLHGCPPVRCRAPRPSIS